MTTISSRELLTVSASNSASTKAAPSDDRSFSDARIDSGRAAWQKIKETVGSAASSVSLFLLGATVDGVKAVSQFCADRKAQIQDHFAEKRLEKERQNFGIAHGELISANRDISNDTSLAPELRAKLNSTLSAAGRSFVEPFGAISNENRDIFEAPISKQTNTALLKDLNHGKADLAASMHKLHELHRSIEEIPLVNDETRVKLHAAASVLSENLLKELKANRETTLEAMGISPSEKLHKAQFVEMREAGKKFSPEAILSSDHLARSSEILSNFTAAVDSFSTVVADISGAASEVDRKNRKGVPVHDLGDEQRHEIITKVSSDVSNVAMALSKAASDGTVTGAEEAALGVQIRNLREGVAADVLSMVDVYIAKGEKATENAREIAELDAKIAALRKRQEELALA